jgi:hypothetical protein
VVSLGSNRLERRIVHGGHCKSPPVRRSRRPSLPRSGPIFDSGTKLLSCFLSSSPSIDQMTQTIIIVGQSGLWSPEVQELNIFGRVEGLIRIRAVKDKIGVLIVAEACPPKLDHRLSSDSTDRTISLDAPLDKINFSVVSHTCL